MGVRGRSEDRVNHGRLGPKGLHGWEANNSSDRLKVPLIRRGNRFIEARWDEAMNLIVSQSKNIRDRHTSSAIGFYTSGQLFLEEYYTLAVIGKAGLGTPHMDGNTRLCTATAAAALKESFGTDGQPGSYTDLDTTDAIFDVGHNMAEQQTVLWTRVLDRLAGPRRPKLVIMDPRPIPAAKEADVHLAPKPGTNVVVLNGLLRLIIQNGWISRAYIDAHTMGFEDLERTVAKWTPELVELIADVPQRKLHAAAEILGTAPTLVSAVLQGVYQSMQATAAACQVNNLHLIRGLIGRDGCGVYQMNGQPTAQNARECGADGDLPGFRNWSNPTHIEELARLWNVSRDIIPHWAPPTHAMQIFRYCEQGSIKMLWISATNPAVSLPNLPRIRRILDQEDLFLVVQDAFMTETAARADVVLPAAIWGEKTGCFTNVDRTVHLSHQAVEPPGEARSDFDIFLDYARRILDLVQEARATVAGEEPQGSFPLGSLESTAAVRIPELLAAYNQKHAKVELDLSTGPSGTMIDGVLSGRLAAAFVDGPVLHPALEGVPAFEEEMVLIAPLNHDPIHRAKDVNGENIYAFRSNCSYRHHFESWFANGAAVPGKIFEMESYHGMLACVSAGAGLALMPRSMLESMPGCTTVSVWPLSESFRYLRTWLVWRRGTVSQSLTMFVRLLEERGVALIDK